MAYDANGAWVPDWWSGGTQAYQPAPVSAPAPAPAFDPFRIYQEPASTQPTSEFAFNTAQQTQAVAPDMYQSLQQQSLLPLNMETNQAQKYPEFASLFQQATSSYKPTSWNTTQGTETTTQTSPSSFYTDPATGQRWNMIPQANGTWWVLKDTGKLGEVGATTPVDILGSDGKYLGSTDYTKIDGNASWQAALAAALAMAGGAAMMGGMSGAGAAGAEGLGAAGAAGTGTSGAVGGAGGFIGEGALSGIGAWDGALASAPSWSAGAGAGAAGAAGSGGGGSGFTFNPALDSQAANQALGAEALSGYTGAPIPSVTVNGVPGGGSWYDSLVNAFTPSPGSSAGNALGSLTGGGGSNNNNLLGLGSSLLGGLSGAQGQQGSTSSTRTMDPRLDQPVYGAGGLVPRTQETLASQYPMAQQYGGQLMSTGSNLLGQTAPTTATNPYLSSITDDMQRRTQELLGENNRALQVNAIGVGGLGGSRQGVAQGVAAGRAADSLQGQIANLYGQAYNQDQNRLRQDWTIGSGLLNQGQQMQFAPMQSTSNIYQPFTGFGTTTSNADSGGGWSSALGGLLSGAALGRQMGWW